MLGVRLSEDLENKMEGYVKAHKITKSQLVKQAVGDFLRAQELKAYHDKKTVQGFREIEQGKGIPGKVVFNLLNSWRRYG